MKTLRVFPGQTFILIMKLLNEGVDIPLLQTKNLKKIKYNGTKASVYGEF